MKTGEIRIIIYKVNWTLKKNKSWKWRKRKLWNKVLNEREIGLISFIIKNINGAFLLLTYWKYTHKLSWVKQWVFKKVTI